MKSHILIITLSVFLVCCTKEEKMTIDQIRQEEIDKRVNQFISVKEKECHQNAMKSAIAIADSLLKLNAVKYIEDSLQRPPLPEKPEKNIKPIPIDSIEVEPFLRPDTILPLQN